MCTVVRQVQYWQPLSIVSVQSFYEVSQCSNYGPYFQSVSTLSKCTQYVHSVYANGNRSIHCKRERFRVQSPAAPSLFYLNGGWVAPWSRVLFPDQKYICTTGRFCPFSHRAIACHSIQLLLATNFIQPARDGPIHTDNDFCIWMPYWYRLYQLLVYIPTTYSHNVLNCTSDSLVHKSANPLLDLVCI